MIASAGHMLQSWQVFLEYEQVMGWEPDPELPMSLLPHESCEELEAFPL